MKKLLKEWGVIAALFGFLYFTGLYTDVAALAQRAVLSTGLITADVEIEDPEMADYNLELKSLDGSVSNMNELKGKVIFLNLWATWCPPCIAEMPGIQDLYEKVDTTKIAFVMLSLDKNPQKAAKFIENKEYTLPVYLPQSRIPDVFRSQTIPATYIISADGKIVSHKTGMANYDTKKFFKFLEKQALEVSQ